MNELAQQLQAPFREDEYEWRAQMASAKGDKVQVLCYVTARAIMDRLDEVFGPMGWSDNYAGAPVGGVMCRITAEYAELVATKTDVAENTDIEAIKGGFSGAFKRAGVKWGIGRLLYKLDASWVPLKDRGQHWFKYPQKHAMSGQSAYWDDPPLPADMVVGGPTSRKQPRKAERVAAADDDAKTIGDGLADALTGTKVADAPTVEMVKWALLELVAAKDKIDIATAKAKVGGHNKTGQLLKTIGEVFDLAGSIGYREALAAKMGLTEDGEVIPHA